MSTYRDAFEVFLSHTDEKKKLLDALIKIIDARSVNSILDIGAGGGVLSEPLSMLPSVRRFVAIERDKEYAEALRGCGGAVIEGEFPLENSRLDESFDTVLVSHALPYSPSSKRERFLSAALEYVRAGGVLLVVTYRGPRQDAWTRLMEYLGEPIYKRNAAEWQELLAFAESRGTISVREVVSRVNAPTAQELIDALEFVAAYGDPERQEWWRSKREELVAYLERRRSDKGFSFPFVHWFLLVGKRG